MFPPSCYPKWHGISAFSPAALSPLIWLDATKLMLTDGALVSSFTDISGNGNNFLQATTLNQPKYVLTAINGLPAVLGDGLTSFMRSPTIESASSWWGLVLVQQITSSGNSGFWSPSAHPDGSPFILLNGVTGSGAGFNTNAVGGFGLIGTYANLTTYAFLTQWSPTVATLADNLGNLSTSSANPTAKPAVLQTIFAWNDPGQFANCLIGELLYGEGVLTSAQVSALWKYIGTKWGITHP